MKYEIEFRVNFRKAQGLANSPKAQEMDSARSHNAEENHKGHKFCVGRVRFGIFWPTDWTNHRSLTLWICLVFKTKFLKPTWDTTCEGKSEMKCAGQMQNKKWNDTVKLSCLNLTQFLKQHETFPPDPVLTLATFAKKSMPWSSCPGDLVSFQDWGRWWSFSLNISIAMHSKEVSDQQRVNFGEIFQNVPAWIWP